VQQLKSVPVVVDSRVDDLVAREVLLRVVPKEVPVLVLLRPALLPPPVWLSPLVQLLPLLLQPLPPPPLLQALLFQVQTTQQLAPALAMLPTSNPR